MGYARVKERIRLILQETLKEMLDEAGKEWDGEVTLDDTPPSIELGDFGTAVSFQLARVFRRAPKLIAEELVERLRGGKLPDEVAEVKAVNGYVNFYLDYETFGKGLVREILEGGERPTVRGGTSGPERKWWWNTRP